MNNRKGDSDAAILLVFVIPVVLIFGIRSCAMKAYVSADQSAHDLFTYISSMSTIYFMIYALLINVFVTIVSGIMSVISINDKEPDSEDLAVPIILGYILSILALLLTKGNITIMILINIIITHVITAGMQNKNLRSLFGLVSISIVFAIVTCINHFYFPAPKPKHPSPKPQVVKQISKTNRQLLSDRYKQVQKLITLLSNDFNSVSAKINELDINNSVDKQKLEILVNEKSNIEQMIITAKKASDSCDVLMTRYDSAERIVKLNRELGKINIESQRSLDQIEQEIKNFLVESKSISIQLNGQL